MGVWVPEVNLGPQLLNEVSHRDLDPDKQARLAGLQSPGACLSLPPTIASYFYMDAGVELRSSTS